MFPATTLSVFWTILTALAAVQLTTAFDTRDQNSLTSAFVYGTEYGNITFAVTAVHDVGDLYFHLEAPADNSWVAVGTGKEMKGSLIWVIYQNQYENGVTLSTRTASGNFEPTYDEKLDCDLNVHDGITNGIVSHDDNDLYVVNGYCKGINNGTLDFSSSQQPFIFALGPADRQIHTDSKSADIRRHALYGQFNLDLSKATVDTTLDVAFNDLAAVATWQNHNAQIAGSPTQDRDWTGPIHSVAMCGTFVILFPLGVVLLRVLEKVQWHACVQGLGCILLVGGVGLGLWVGREYNHSKKVNSIHQIFGLSIVVLTLVQFGLGFTHHLLYKRRQRPTILGRIHLYLGPIVLLIGAANGFLGFNFSGGGYHNIMYGVLVGVVFAGLAGILFWTKRRQMQKKRFQARHFQDDAYEALRHQDDGNANKGGARGEDVMLQPMGIPLEAPPSYEESRAVPRPMV